MKDFSELKVGDECFIRARVRGVERSSMRFDTIDENGKMLMDFSFSLVAREYNSILTADDLQQEVKPTHNEEAEENKPKYDPCRLLRKGDRVQVKKRNGRCNGKAGEYLREAFCEVADDEVPNERVRVYHNSSEYRLDPAYLELITPVEELEHYSVVDAHTHWDVAVKDMKTIASYSKVHHPNAKAAAEAECKRLNAEWRKEQNDD